MQNKSDINSFNLLLNNIKKQPYIFINSDFEKNIDNVVINFFPKLNKNDINILQILTKFIIDVISYKYDFNKLEDKYYQQWTQNNNRDVKGVILLLLPFIDDTSDVKILENIEDLNQLLYFEKTSSIPNTDLDIERNELLKTQFRYGNMAIGLLSTGTKDNLLELFVNEEKLIYKLIYHTLIGLLHTLEVINGKCYINWINIVPLNLNNYNESNIYKKTVERLNVCINNPSLITNNLIGYSGLWFGDFYNILVNKYYEDVKRIKWLFFPYELSDTNKIYLIQGLNLMFDLDKLINLSYYTIEDIDNKIKTYFINKYTKVLQDITDNITYTGMLKVDIELIKYLLIYFINNYSEINLFTDSIFTNFKLEKIDEDNKNDDFFKNDLVKIKKITFTDIINCFQYVITNYLVHLLIFLKNSIYELKFSSYGKFLINSENNKLSISKKYYYEPFNKAFIKNNKFKLKINLKNIYNISKSLCHNNSTSWDKYEPNYISLADSLKELFFDRINNLNELNKSLNLQGNLKRQIIYKKYDYDTEINKIFNSFKLIYINLIFEELVSTGILNKFEVNLEITDKKFHSSNFNIQKQSFKNLMKKNINKNKTDWYESYYYLTNDKYKNLNKIKIDKSVINYNYDKYDDFDFFELIVKQGDWTTFYAMDWVSQISFFQHYIYHQILYITGATGQGKSTQVPKLLLYALKMIDYKQNGKIICTQPRIIPTENNAQRISQELGLPIEEPCNTSITNIETNNFYVQYKHQQKNHNNNNIYHSSLNIVTDGTLQSIIKNNLSMYVKKQIKDTFRFINKNIYDIIIIDEAHEHNKNMDIILTLARQTCYLNNKVRLIIISATMQEDDPIYRSYYSLINDNLVYPIKFPISNLELELSTFIPQSKYMDRRYHISPPGETTQYKVKEYYEESENIIDISNTIHNKIREICTTTIKGDILLFLNGAKEISDMVDILNNDSTIPSNTVALPYYTNLNVIYKDLISNIKLSSIINNKSNIHLEWTDKYTDNPIEPVSKGTYSRAIIIATNVAEASITIPTLEYVIDNGYNKINDFNQDIGKTTLVIKPITDASRIQRKGRVGRVKDGTVYYMYPKNARKDVIPSYKITQEDASNIILELLCNKTYDEILIDDIENVNKLLISKYNPNNYNNYKIFGRDINEYSSLFIVRTKLFEIFQNNYTTYKIGFDEQYYNYNTLEEEENSIINKVLVFDNGQLIENLLDKPGNFYLIHPFENIITRNILHNIIKVENKLASCIVPIYYKNILFNLFNKNLIIDYQTKDIYHLNVHSSYRRITKTELTSQINEITNESLNISDALTLISASAMGCYSEVNELIILLKIINYSLSNIIMKNIKWNIFKDFHTKTEINSDIIFLYNIIKDIKQNLKELISYIQSNVFKNKLIQYYKKILIQFVKLNKQPILTFDGLLWNKLMNLKYKNILIVKNESLINDISFEELLLNNDISDEYIKVLLNDNITKTILNNEILKYIDNINIWCNNNLYNSEMIINFINKLLMNYLSDNINYNPESKINKMQIWTKKINNNYNKFLNTNTIDEKIIRSFLYSNGIQFTTPAFLFDRSHQTILNLTNYNVKFADTFINLSDDIIFYLNYDESKTDEYNEIIDTNSKRKSILEVSLLSHINISWLLPALPLIINPTYQPVIYYEDVITSRLFRVNKMNSPFLQKFKRDILNLWNPSYNIWNTSETPFLKEYYIKINQIINNMIS